jgi:hypothetical protein
MYTSVTPFAALQRMQDCKAKGFVGLDPDVSKERGWSDALAPADLECTITRPD